MTPLEERLELLSKIDEIQTQLASRNRTYQDDVRQGQRMTSEDYHAWRHKALTALNHRLARLRALNAELYGG